MSDEIIPPTPPTPDVPPVQPTPYTPGQYTRGVQSDTSTYDSSYPSVPDYTSNTSAPRKKAKGKKWLFIALGIFSILVLSGIGVFAFNILSNTTGGADSPEGVITNFSNAANDHDLPAMLSGVDPNEVEPLIENLTTFTSSAKKDGAIENEKKPLEAYSFQFKDLKTKTVMYSDDVARVELLSGKFIVKVDKSKLPKDQRRNAKDEVTDFEKSSKDLINGAKDSFDNFKPNDMETKNNFYIAIKRDGKWYASALYTAAEYSRIFANGLGQEITRPNFDASDRVGVGADSGEKAVGNFLEALVSLRTKDIIEATAPDRFSLGYDYKKTLMDLQNVNAGNQYVKLAKDAITISDIKTTAKADGKNREFNEIKSVSLKIKYNIDVPSGQESIYSSYPYAADLDAKWDGKCLSYSGEIKAYQVAQTPLSTYDFSNEAPYIDASGTTIEDSYSLYDAKFPITSANGNIYPSDDSTYFDAYHPLPWTDAKGAVVFDAAGNPTANQSDSKLSKDKQSYPWVDAQGAEIYDAKGRATHPETSFEKVRTNVDEKTCFSKKELKSIPSIGFITIKENGSHYVSPIDTAWYYIIRLMKDQN